MKNLHPKYFVRTYEYVQWLRNTIIYNIEDEDLLYFLQIDEPLELTDSIIETFLKPQKHSYLHEFIDNALYISFEYESRKFANAKEWNKLTSSFLNIEIDEIKFNEYTEEGEEYKEMLEGKIKSDILPLITEEVFSILFCDKEFLFHFNLFISSKLKKIEPKSFPNLFNHKGHVHRVQYWPKWLVKGVFYRDRGRCSYCFNDISGLLNVENKLNIDHIIPLANGGTNDTSNCQILCERCNKEKKEKIITLKKYKYFKTF